MTPNDRMRAAKRRGAGPIDAAASVMAAPTVPSRAAPATAANILDHARNIVHPMIGNRHAAQIAAWQLVRRHLGRPPPVERSESAARAGQPVSLIAESGERRATD